MSVERLFLKNNVLGEVACISRCLATIVLTRWQARRIRGHLHYSDRMEPPRAIRDTMRFCQRSSKLLIINPGILPTRLEPKANVLRLEEPGGHASHCRWQCGGERQCHNTLLVSKIDSGLRNPGYLCLSTQLSL